MEKEIVDLLDVILRCIVSLVTLFLVTKMIGKKQVSQFSLFDYVIGISIGNFAAEMAINLDSSYLHGTVAVIVFGLVAYLVSLITMKSLRLRKLIIGDPNILIKDGKILYNSLKKSKFDINDLLEEARINGYFDISDIDFALMEANGKISFLPKPENQNPTNKDLKLIQNRKGLCVNLIIDGQIIERALKDVHKDENWLLHEIKVKGYKLNEILLATIDLEENFKVYGKNVKDKTYNVLN
ncbi:MAG: DUF421 domain-containing protein [Bacilli bacterium]|nr:DUF421 domain-containing protein [Bacilli bacterium]